MAICDQKISHHMQIWGSMGRFLLQDTQFPKVFIGTGTGFAPLYFMLKKQMNNEK
jgi:NAD(P)H-flavin reductase